MKRILIFLAAIGPLLSADCAAVTYTEDLNENSDAYGVFWVRSDAADPKDPAPMDHPTFAEFDQKVTLYIKDLADWWTIKRDDGLTEEKSLESFIDTLVLVIDGVPLKKLQPIAVTSYTPPYPYHKLPPATLAEAKQIWTDWQKSSGLLPAEDKSGQPQSGNKSHREKIKKTDAPVDEPPAPSETVSNSSAPATPVSTETGDSGGKVGTRAGKGGRYSLLTFELSRESEDQGAWMQILRPEKFRPQARRRCRISVGFERKDHGFQEMVSWVRPVPETKGSRGADQFFLLAMPPRMLWLFGIVFSIALLILVLAGRSGMLRDSAAPARPDGACPYSLARCQMAFWLLLIVLAFVFLWQMLGRKDTVNDTATILLGISSFTAVGSALIVKKSGAIAMTREQVEAVRIPLQSEMSVLQRDRLRLLGELGALQNQAKALTGNWSRIEKELLRLGRVIPESGSAEEKDKQEKVRIAEEEKTAAERSIAVITAEIAARNQAIRDKQTEMEAKKAELQQLNARVNYPGFLGIPGFFKDLLTDSEQNFSIARFQMLVWTSTLGIVFIVEVLWKLAMPEFNTSILALLGITSGTYLGFKGAEKKTE